MAQQVTITIAKTDCGFEREPMVRPFGFKGGYLTEEWIVSAYVQSASGSHGIGLGTQNCLWSDAKVFVANSEAGANAIIYSPPSSSELEKILMKQHREEAMSQ